MRAGPVRTMRQWKVYHVTVCRLRAVRRAATREQTWNEVRNPPLRGNKDRFIANISTQCFV